MDYHERLNKVNANCNDITKTVWDSIDRPIRPLIYELHRIGLKTKFSCCGFNYDGEEEPKNHHKKLSYVFIYTPTNGKIAEKFFQLTTLAQQCGWNMTYFNSNIWHMNVSNSLPNLYSTKEEEPDVAIHDHETQVLAIHHLTKRISNEIGTYTGLEGEINIDEIEIVDGNKAYQDAGIDEWQVKPKRSVALKIAKAQLDEEQYKKDISKEVDNITENMESE